VLEPRGGSLRQIPRLSKQVRHWPKSSQQIKKLRRGVHRPHKLRVLYYRMNLDRSIFFISGAIASVTICGVTTTVRSSSFLWGAS